MVSNYTLIHEILTATVYTATCISVAFFCKYKIEEFKYKRKKLRMQPPPTFDQSLQDILDEQEEVLDYYRRMCVQQEMNTTLTEWKQFKDDIIAHVKTNVLSKVSNIREACEHLTDVVISKVQ